MRAVVERAVFHRLAIGFRDLRFEHLLGLHMARFGPCAAVDQIFLQPLDRVAERPPAIRRAKAVEADRHLRFEELLSLSNEMWAFRVVGGDAQTGLMYLQSWSMVHFLINADRGEFRRMFERYLELISEGWESMRAFREAFGTDDIASFEDAWRRDVLDLEPDELSTATERLEFLGAGLAWLHERGVTPDSVASLRAALRERDFEMHRRGHGMMRTLSADDDELFEAPAPDRRTRREPALMLTAPDGDLPPGAEITGLRTHVALVWEREDGTLVRRIEYR